MRSFLPEGSLLHTAANQTAMQTMEGLRQAMQTGQILEARAIACDSSYNLLVDLPGIRGIIPHQEGAMGIPEGTTRDIARSEERRVGKECTSWCRSRWSPYH